MIAKLLESLSKLSFFTVSLLLHVVLVSLLGSAVLVKEMIPRETFVAVPDTDGFLSEVEVSSAPPAEQTSEFEEMTFAPEAMEASTAPAVAVAALSALATDSSAASTFSVNPATATQNFGNSMSGSTDLMASAATQVGGGSSKGMSRNLGGGMSSFFGGVEVQNGLTGTFYDLKQTDKETPSKMAPTPGEEKTSGVVGSPEAGKANGEFTSEMREFVKKGMRESYLSKYFQAPQKLNSYQLFIPNMSAGEAPKAFQVADKVQPRRWAAVYRGNIRPPADGKFRFSGKGDDILVVRLNGKVVLDGSLGNIAGGEGREGGDDAAGHRVGPWVRMDRSRSYPIEILIGETPGGVFYQRLFVEQEGVQHKGGKALFQTTAADLPKEIAEKHDGLVFDYVN